MKAVAVLGCFLLLALAPDAWGATTGKIAGTMTDAKSGAPIVGAVVQINNTKLGAITDDKGQFFILNVPPGDYTLDAHAIGFRDTKQQNVHVTVDFTTTVDFKMEETVAATTEEVVVEGKRPLIQKDATSTVRIITSEEIQNSPARGYQEIVAQSTGVTSFANYNSAQVIGPQIAAVEHTNTPVLAFRGGRPNEVGYFVDGFSQQDLLSGLTTTTVPNAALSEIVVQPGGFGAEYGRNLSGVVNVTTKEGGDEFSGSAEVLTDVGGSFLGNHDYDQNVYAASFGGPLLGQERPLRFYAAVERGWDRDQSPSPIEEGPLPNNSNGSWRWSGNVTTRLGSQFRLKLGSTGSVQDWREFRTDYRFDLPHAPRYRDQNLIVNGIVTHTIDSRSFQTLAVGYFYTDRKRGDGMFFDDFEDAGWDSTYGSYGQEGNPTYSNEALYWFGPDDPEGAHIFDNFLHRQSEYIEAKWDYTRQLDSKNNIKVGADFQRHSLEYFEHLQPRNAFTGSAAPFTDVQSFGFDSTGLGDVVGGSLDDTKHPISFAAYVQDKIEIDELVIQPGIRYDYFNAETERLIDESNPLNESGELTEDRLTDAEAKHTFSPRLGIAFAINPRTHFHANYGKFYQQPDLKELYTNYSYLEYKARIGGYYYAFGNPNLDPQKTTSYEVGFARALSTTAKVELSAYYKAIKGLSQVENIPSNPSNFTSFRNRDFGTVRGIDLFLYSERVNRLQGSVSYSLSYAEGTGSISQSQRNIAWTASEPPKQTSPLAFDQRHKMSISMDYRYARDDGPKYLSEMGLNVLFTAGSGLPYTPLQVFNEVTLNAVSLIPIGPLNSRYSPWTYQFDAKLDKGFHLGRTNMNVFIIGENIFNRENVTNVYGSSGLPDNTGWLATPEGQAFLAANGPDAEARYNLAQQDPRNFGTPRIVRVGLKTSF